MRKLLRILGYLVLAVILLAGLAVAFVMIKFP